MKPQRRRRRMWRTRNPWYVWIKGSKEYPDRLSTTAHVFV
jgi:hypothetical protein